jgi:hypothetical protein
MKRMILVLPLLCIGFVFFILFFSKSNAPLLDVPSNKSSAVKKASFAMLTKLGKKEVWQNRQSPKDCATFKFDSSVIFSENGELIQDLFKLSGRMPSRSSTRRTQVCDIQALYGRCNLSAGLIKLPKAHLLMYEPSSDKNLSPPTYRPHLIADGACKDLDIQLHKGLELESGRVRATLFSPPQD